jgi:TonB family protein
MTNKNNQISDIELVLHTIGYNVSAYEQLYDRYSSISYTLIKRIIPDPILAQKILLNVFSVFLKRIEFYDTSKDNVFTWILLLTRNISLDILRRTKSENLLPIYDDKYEIEVILPKLSKKMNSIIFDGSTDKIKTYKDNLSEVQNLVLSLAYFEGQNEEEIAKKLNLTVVATKEKILHTMKSLMQIYLNHEEFSGLNKQVIDLIKLDVIGCLSEEEKKQFNIFKQNSQIFLWKELGDYQNLMALIPTSLPSERPPIELSGKIKQLMVSAGQGKGIDSTASLISEQKKQTFPSENIILEESKTADKKIAIKFKEPDQNPLFLFKKQETQKKPKEVVSKLDENDIKIMDRNTTTTIHSVISNKKVIRTSTLLPTSDRFKTEIKTEELPSFKKEVNSISAEDQKIIRTRTIQPTSERFNLNPKTAQPLNINKGEQTVQAKIIKPTSDRFNINTRVTVEPPKENSEQVSPKAERTTQTRSIKPTSERFNTNINSKIQEAAPPKENSAEVSAKELIKVTSQSISAKAENPKVNTQFDNSTISFTKRAYSNSKNVAVKDLQNTLDPNPAVNNSVNFGEIVSRIEDQNRKGILKEEIIKDNDEVKKLKKKLRRNFYISAFVIIFLIISSIFIYLKFKSISDMPLKKMPDIGNQKISTSDNPIITPSTKEAVIKTDTIKAEQIIAPEKKPTEQTDSSLPLVDSTLSGNNILSEAENDNNLASLTNTQLNNKPMVVDDKVMKASSLTKITSVKENPNVFVAVEEQPQLIGGLQGIQDKIHYPEMAKNLGIEGRVVVQAIVDELGNVISVSTIKGIGGGCDEIAMTAVKDSKFIPGKQEGKPVKVQVAIPILFKH